MASCCKESRTACNCPYLLLTLGSLSVNRRVPVLLSSILYLPLTHGQSCQAGVISPSSNSGPPRLIAMVLTGLGGLLK